MSSLTMSDRSPLISAAGLAKRISEASLILLDATMLMPTPQGRAAYQPTERIANARYFNFDTEICDSSNPLPHMMPSAEQFQAQVRALGVNDDSHIVVYDTLGLFSAARAWWMFRAMGHEHVAVLDGGLPAWKRAGLPTDHYPLKATVYPGDFTAKPQPKLFCAANEVLAALQQSGIKVVDARGSERFSGTGPEPRAGMRSGHMPNAVNLPYASLLDTDGCLKPQAELAASFAKQVGNAERYIFSCGSGVTACILALVAEVLGYQNLSIYDGSWSEWGASAELPVVSD
ncbi:sulfurtransferase [Corallincola luteus]|uniref:Sulfurtransferase n=1 Tax=Corallincola luteus TaxID=1775177 RepID=A0ABY2AQR8_9GAMM|nr:sulfurtransferase [Corallincola luteus]TCI04127.1 sulfurtransferase [Corallincola luteus]